MKLSQKHVVTKSGAASGVSGRPGNRNVIQGQAWPCYSYVLTTQHTHKWSKMPNPGSLDGFYFFSQYFGNVFLLVGGMEREDLGFGFCCGQNTHNVMNSFIQLVQTMEQTGLQAFVKV